MTNLDKKINERTMNLSTAILTKQEFKANLKYRLTGEYNVKLISMFF